MMHQVLYIMQLPNKEGDMHVLVISPLGVMLLVYRPDTRGRVAPEGEGL